MNENKYTYIIECMKTVLSLKENLKVLFNNPLSFKDFKIDRRIEFISNAVTELKNMIEGTSDKPDEILSFKSIKGDPDICYDCFIVSSKKGFIKLFIFDDELNLVPYIIDTPVFEKQRYRYPVYCYCKKTNDYIGTIIFNQFKYDADKEVIY